MKLKLNLKKNIQCQICLKVSEKVAEDLIDGKDTCLGCADKWIKDRGLEDEYNKWEARKSRDKGKVFTFNTFEEQVEILIWEGKNK